MSYSFKDHNARMLSKPPLVPRKVWQAQPAAPLQAWQRLPGAASTASAASAAAASAAQPLVPLQVRRRLPGAAAASAAAASAAPPLTPEEKEQKLYESLANLFQWLNDDDIITKIKNSGKTTTTVRKYFEDKLASTSQQSKLSQNLHHRAENNIAGLPEVMELPNKEERKTLTRSEFDNRILSYGENYCWLSGIKITDDNGNYHSASSRYRPCNPNANTINEPEHAISFYVMLIFFGGISSIPNNLYIERFKAYNRIVREMVRSGRLDRNLNPLVPITDLEINIIRNVQENLAGIQRVGTDLNLTTRTYAFSNDLLGLMGFDGAEKAEFLLNKEKMNFYGLWPSFCYLNQWKSNFNFIRLGFEYDENTKKYHKPYFKPSKTLIKSFVDFSNALMENQISTAETIAKARLPKNQNPTYGGPDNNKRVFFYNRTSNGLVKKSDYDARKNKYFKGWWSKAQETEIPKKNITIILDLLCSIANYKLIDRVFYNCVIVCYLFKYGTKSRLTDFADIQKGKFGGPAAQQVFTSSRANTAMRRNITNTRTTSEVSSEEQGTIMNELEKSTDNIEEYIRCYINYKKLPLYTYQKETYEPFGNVARASTAVAEQRPVSLILLNEIIPMLKEIMERRFQVKRTKTRQKTKTKTKTKRPSPKTAAQERASIYTEKRVRKGTQKSKKKRKEENMRRRQTIAAPRQSQVKRTGTGKKKKKKKTRQKNRGKKNKKGGGKKKTKRKRTRKKKN